MGSFYVRVATLPIPGGSGLAAAGSEKLPIVAFPACEFVASSRDVAPRAERTMSRTHTTPVVSLIIRCAASAKERRAGAERLRTGRLPRSEHIQGLSRGSSATNLWEVEKGKPLAREGRKTTGLPESAGSPI
jgi:hypothetical protein